MVFLASGIVSSAKVLYFGVNVCTPSELVLGQGGRDVSHLTAVVKSF